MERRGRFQAMRLAVALSSSLLALLLSHSQAARVPVRSRPRTDRQLQGEGAVVAERNLVDNPSFEKSAVGLPPVNWIARGNATVVKFPTIDGTQAIQLSFCQVCNPALIGTNSGQIIVGFRAVPKQWYNLYFYVVGFGTPGVAQTLQVTAGTLTYGVPGQGTVFNFSVVPGANSYASPGNGGSLADGAGLFEMGSASFQAVTEQASVMFDASLGSGNTFILDMIVVVPAADPVGVTTGNSFSLAQPCYASCPAPAALLSGGASISNEAPTATDPVFQQVITLGTSRQPTGSAFFQQPLSLLTSSGGVCSSFSFSMSFTFRVMVGANASAPPAGLAFVLSPEPVQGQGGSMLGYGRLCGGSFVPDPAGNKLPWSTQDKLCRPGVAVEFDGFQDLNMWDVNGNHVALDANFNPISLEASDLGSTPAPFLVSDGAWHRINVAYNTTASNLHVTVANSASSDSPQWSPILHVDSFDLCTLAAGDPLTHEELAYAPLYFGFTGSASGSTIQVANASFQVLDPASSSAAVPTEVMSSTGASGNMVVNPSFESWLPQGTPPSGSLMAPDFASIPGWTISAGSAWVLQTPTPYNNLPTTCQAAPQEGSSAIALGGCPAALCAMFGQSAPGEIGVACFPESASGSVTQIINGTLPGKQYMLILSAWVPGPANSSVPSTLTVKAGDVSIQLALTPPALAVGMVSQFNYQQVMVPFKATGMSTEVTLSGSVVSGSVVVDSVSVMPAPASSSNLTVDGIGSPVSGFNLANFSAASFKAALAPPAPPVNVKAENLIGRLLKGVSGEIPSQQKQQQPTLALGPTQTGPTPQMFTAGTSATSGAPGSSSAPWLTINTPQQYSTGLALFPVPVGVVTTSPPTDPTATPSCTPRSFAVDFSVQMVSANPGANLPAPSSGGFALVLQQDPTVGNPSGNSLGFIRTCQGSCGGGMAVGFPGAPSCVSNTPFIGKRKGSVLLSSTRPPQVSTSSVCTETQNGSIPGGNIWGVTVVYDSVEQTLAAWISPTAGIGSANITQVPALIARGINTCKVLIDGRTGAAAASVGSNMYLGFSAATGDCGGNPQSCVEYRVLSFSFTNLLDTVPQIPPGPPGPPAPNPFDTQVPPGYYSPPPPTVASSTSLPLWIIVLAVGAWVVALLIVTGCLILVMRRRAATFVTTGKGTSTPGKSEKGSVPVSPSPSAFRRIPISEIHRATRGFHVSRQIGTPGAYGAVYKGHSTLGQMWAVKRYKMGSGVSPACLTNFDEEVTRLHESGVEGVTPLVGFFSLPDPPEYIAVYQYEHMESLFEALHKKKEPVLSMEQRVRIIVGLADTLAGMHSRTPPLAHRNIKPANILLSSEFRAQLTDFCFAHALGQPAKAEGDESGGESQSSSSGQEMSGGDSGGSNSHSLTGTLQAASNSVLSPVKEEPSGPLSHSGHSGSGLSGPLAMSGPLNSSGPLVIRDRSGGEVVESKRSGGSGRSGSNKEGGEEDPLTGSKTGGEVGVAPTGKGESEEREGGAGGEDYSLLPGTVLDVMEIIGEPSQQTGNVSGTKSGANGGRRPPFVPKRAQREGYIDPEVVMGISSNASPKTDVFSFGVVVLELLTGRLAVMPDPDDPQTNLVITDWAVHYIQTGEVNLIADPRIFSNALTEPMLKLGQIAVECVRMPSRERPDMATVAELLRDITSKYFESEMAVPASTNAGEETESQQ